MSEAEAVFMVVQEAPTEMPSTLYVMAQSPEAAVACVPDAAKEFYGEIPAELRTWRITWEGEPRVWRIYETVWSGQAGEVLVEPAAVPGPVVVLLVSYAGKTDGFAQVIYTEAVLCDVNGGEAQFDRAFPQGCGDVTKAARALYAANYSAGVSEAVTIAYKGRQIANGGPSS